MRTTKHAALSRAPLNLSPGEIVSYIGLGITALGMGALGGMAIGQARRHDFASTRPYSTTAYCRHCGLKVYVALNLSAGPRARRLRTHVYALDAAGYACKPSQIRCVPSYRRVRVALERGLRHRAPRATSP